MRPIHHKFSYLFSLSLRIGQNDIGRWTWIYRIFIIVWILFGLGYLIMVDLLLICAIRSAFIIFIFDLGP